MATNTFIRKLERGGRMSVIAEFDIPAEEFALYETLERRPEMNFEIDRVVAHETTYVVPFVRAKHGNFEKLTEIIEADPSVAEVELLAEIEDECFYRMVWSERAQVIGYMVAGQNATIQEASASNGRWNLRVFFPDRSALSATSEYARESNLSLDVTRIYSVEELEKTQYNLTEDQHETLTTAIECGYYDIPRETNAADLADELGISHQALSERFRRATKNLIKSTLLVEDDKNS